jgi:glycosyltransferase involved in cell wall biosynthesis
VSVACPESSILRGLLAESDASIHRWDANRSPGPSVPRETVHLARLLRSIPSDIVHLHSSKAGLAGRLAVRGRTPTVFQPHAWSFHALTGPLRRVAVMWERFSARNTDALVCVSRAEKEIGSAAGIEGAWEVVPNGVDLDVWARPTQDDRHAARTRLQLPHGDPYAVCVGRLSQQKGQDVLLRAWPAVHERLPKARLVLIGDGPARGELQRAASPRVQFVGVRADVRDWLLAADVVALPSRWEGFSLVLLEAMATACSVVATDTAGSAEALRRDGGLVIPIEDEPALASGLIDRLRDRELSEREGRAARATVEREFDLRKTTEAMAAVYDKILARS